MVHCTRIISVSYTLQYGMQILVFPLAFFDRHDLETVVVKVFSGALNGFSGMPLHELCMNDSV